MKRGSVNVAASSAAAWVDFVKVVGLGLVLAGSAAWPIIWRRLSKLSMNDLYFTILVDIISRLGPPLLFIVLGYEIVPAYKPPATRFYRRMVLQALIPVIVWSVLFCLADAGRTGNFHNPKPIVERYLRDFFAIHLWFFYALVSLYITTPLINVVVNHGQRGVLILALVLWFFADPATATTARFWDLHSPFMFQIQGFRGGWTGYYVIGAVLAKYDSSLPKRWLAAGSVLMSGTFVAAFYGTLLGTLAKGAKQLSTDWTLIAGAPIVMMSVPLFFGLRWLAESNLLPNNDRLHRCPI
eukprot:TRINITY_DN702_c0_g1_i1.p1 TRINITY_DN702_c0_g1~~TRINITY_DN702_c0_g1_i1.p1  ORF type:complete len:297 (+),score=68.26 TRINITY_DN702_c0_g1_i1:1034-1924(+)